MYQKINLIIQDERSKMKEELVRKYLELSSRRDYYRKILDRGVHLEVDSMYTGEPLVPRHMVDSFKQQLETYFRLCVYELDKQIEAL